MLSSSVQRAPSPPPSRLGVRGPAFATWGFIRSAWTALTLVTRFHDWTKVRAIPAASPPSCVSPDLPSGSRARSVCCDSACGCCSGVTSAAPLIKCPQSASGFLRIPLAFLSFSQPLLPKFLFRGPCLCEVHVSCLPETVKALIFAALSLPRGVSVREEAFLAVAVHFAEAPLLFAVLNDA